MALMTAIPKTMKNGTTSYNQCIRNGLGQGMTDFCWLAVFCKMKVAWNEYNEEEDGERFLQCTNIFHWCSVPFGTNI